MIQESRYGTVQLPSATELAVPNCERPVASKLTLYHRLGKRLLDAVAAAFGLLVISPLLLICAVAVWLDSRGPLFFRQRRVGMCGKPFDILKFRTMVNQTEKNGLRITADGDSRITAVGRWLRKMKLDELPQLFNVLKGEMSLVGPRPEVPEYVAAYDSTQMRVLEFKPGITGPAALAYIDEEKVLASALDKEAFYRNTLMPQKLELDLAYGEHVSFLADMQMIFATLGKLFDSSHEGAPVATLPPQTIHRGSKARFLEAVIQASHRLLHSQVFEFMKEAVNSHLQAAQALIDGGIFAFSFAAAYLIHFAGVPSGSLAMQFVLWLPILLAARLLVNWKMGIYQFMWRFVCLSDAIAIVGSLFTVTSFLLALRLLYPEHAGFSPWIRLPIGILTVEFLLALSVSLAARGVRRMLHEQSRRVHLSPGQSIKRVLLYGAGQAGAMLAGELSNHADIEIVGFLDDNRRKAGSIISGGRVLGTGESLEKIVRQFGVDEVVISIASTSPRALTQILAKCKAIPVKTQIIPTLQEIVEGRVKISQTREIRVEDLLGRGAVNIGEFSDEVRQVYQGKRILVTGAGGSIGSELSRQLLLMNPARLAILDKDENSIYELEHELNFKDPKIPIEAVIADIKIRSKVFAVFEEFQPEVVFHAAAHKHVPLMEKHPCEAVLNNIMGTKNVLEACCMHDTTRFIFISSDKAVNPTNIMGATKRVGEKLVYDHVNSAHFSGACVRFGNVMGSRGSVIPLFQKQIDEGGPVTVTHPDIVRFFMTIPEAVHLVLCAGSLAHRGELFVLDMGSPRKILDLARQVIELSGLEPDKDIQIAFTGLRPGEKMNEELAGPNEALHPTRLEKISVIRQAIFDKKVFRRSVARVIDAAERNDRMEACATLAAMELGFVPGAPLCKEPQPADCAIRAFLI